MKCLAFITKQLKIDRKLIKLMIITRKINNSSNLQIVMMKKILRLKGNHKSPWVSIVSLVGMVVQS